MLLLIQDLVIHDYTERVFWFYWRLKLSDLCALYFDLNLQCFFDVMKLGFSPCPFYDFYVLITCIVLNLCFVYFVYLSLSCHLFIVLILPLYYSDAVCITEVWLHTGWINTWNEMCIRDPLRTVSWGTVECSGRIVIHRFNIYVELYLLGYDAA
jgi:hypothetical protein